MKRKVEGLTKTEDQTPEEKRAAALGERLVRAFWYTVNKFLRELFIAVIIGIIITILIYAFYTLMESYQWIQ